MLQVSESKIGNILTDNELTVIDAAFLIETGCKHILLSPFLVEKLLKCLPNGEVELRKLHVRSLSLKQKKLLQLDKK